MQCAEYLKPENVCYTEVKNTKSDVGNQLLDSVSSITRFTQPNKPRLLSSRAQKVSNFAGAIGTPLPSPAERGLSCVDIIPDIDRPAEVAVGGGGARRSW